MKKRTDNTSTVLKAAIRRKALELISGEHRVLDLYCGETGQMYRKVWKDADLYLGVDLHPHDLAETLQYDNRVFVRSADLNRWNIFDLDAYDSPWKIALTVAKLRTAEDPFALVLTSGEYRGLGNRHTNSWVRQALGINDIPDRRLLKRFQRFTFLRCPAFLREQGALQYIEGYWVIAPGPTRMIYAVVLCAKPLRAATPIPNYEV